MLSRVRSRACDNRASSAMSTGAQRKTGSPGARGATSKVPTIVFTSAERARVARDVEELSDPGLTRHYVYPVCSPTRCALLTGRYASRFGVANPQNNRALPSDTVTLPRALKSVGYDSAILAQIAGTKGNREVIHRDQMVLM